MSGDDRARLEDINASHCATSSLYQYRGQNACQLHHSHSATQVGDTPRTVMMCGRASHGICEQSMLGHGRELTIFWGTDGAGADVWCESETSEVLILMGAGCGAHMAD